MPDAQGAEPFADPRRDDIPAISRHHVAAMEASNDSSAWISSGMSCVVLTTIGRRSGREHKVALPYWRDPDGHMIVVASFAGAARHPAWYLNGADREANELVHARVQDGEFSASFEILEGADYQRTWAALTSDRPWYLDYQARCERRIPLVRLLTETRTS